LNLDVRSKKYLPWRHCRRSDPDLGHKFTNKAVTMSEFPGQLGVLNFLNLKASTSFQRLGILIPEAVLLSLFEVH
jgi:hypothetical protein